MNTRFSIPSAARRGVLFLATVVSGVAGIIAATVHGAWSWMGVPVLLGVALAAEFAAAARRDTELEELVGPLPAPDEIDWELLALHLRAWSEEGR